MRASATRTALLIAALALASASPRAAAATATAAEHEISLAGADFADPFVLREGATYYAFATGTRTANLQVARSEDLVTWSLLPRDPLPVLPSWAGKEAGLTWAPS